MDQTESLNIPLLSNRPTKTKDSQYIYYNNIAIMISTTSFFYNILEGAVSVYFGEVTDSLSLFFFGVQSFVEVLSSVIVLWKVMTSYTENNEQLKMERRATVFIGCLFIFLAIGILIDGIFSLVDHDEPTTTVPNIIVSACATVIMLFLYYTKKKLARELNSSTIQSDAQCSLACIRITTLLLLGSIIYHFWEGGWWIDAAMAIILSILFGKEGIQMLRWASSKDFNGGCCGGCAKMPESQRVTTAKVVCATSLAQNEYQVVASGDQGAKKVADSCCKAGKCSKKSENQTVSSTQIIYSDLESQASKSNAESSEKKAQSGGCCKGGKCSKTAETQKTTPVEVILEVTDKEEVESKPAPKKCCGGGGCKKSAENPSSTPVQVVSQPFLLPESIEEKPVEQVQPAPKKCCSGGGCKKNAASNITAPETINVLSETEVYKNEKIEIKAQEELVPEKKTGGCCKNGKCTKATAPVEMPVSLPATEVIQAEVIEEKPQETPVQKSGGCCKGGKCTKTSAPVEIPVSLPVTEIIQTEVIEEKLQEPPVQKTGGCCKGGKCSKKSEPQNQVVVEPVPEVLVMDKVEPETQVSEAGIKEEEMPKPATKGCCSGGKCSKKTEDASNTTTNNEISLI